MDDMIRNGTRIRPHEEDIQIFIRRDVQPL